MSQMAPSLQPAVDAGCQHGSSSGTIEWSGLSMWVGLLSWVSSRRVLRVSIPREEKWKLWVPLKARQKRSYSDFATFCWLRIPGSVQIQLREKWTSSLKVTKNLWRCLIHPCFLGNTWPAPFYKAVVRLKRHNSYETTLQTLKKYAHSRSLTAILFFSAQHLSALSWYRPSPPGMWLGLGKSSMDSLRGGYVT